MLPFTKKVPSEPKYSEPIQLSLFGSKADNIIDELNKIDITNMTPLQALNKIAGIKKRKPKLNAPVNIISLTLNVFALTEFHLKHYIMIRLIPIAN